MKPPTGCSYCLAGSIIPGLSPHSAAAITLSFHPPPLISHSRLINPMHTPHLRMMLIRLKKRHHLPNSRLHESDCPEELDDLLPAVAELAAEGEDHAGEVFDVGGLGDGAGRFVGVHGGGLEGMMMTWVLEGEELVVLVDGAGRTEARELGCTELLEDLDVVLGCLVKC